MILGAVVIIFAGILIVNYYSGQRIETDTPILVGDETKLPTVHIIGEGEDLWSISEKYYGSGYSWTYIAEENDITNPGLIEKGQELTIPALKEAEDVVVDKEVIEKEEKVEKVVPTATLGPATQAEGKSVHTVQENENLWKIAENYYDSGYNWVDIAKVNNVRNPNLIEIDDELIIPAAEPRKPTIPVISSKDPISGSTYTVVTGDSLWDISIRAFGDGYKWVEIAQENELINPDIIHAGNILTLPR
jgi:putative chitinase